MAILSRRNRDSSSQRHLGRRVRIGSGLRFESLELRRLLHAGNDLGAELPVTEPSQMGTLVEDEILPLGAEQLHSLSSIPVLNSFLGAPIIVYLDFDGHFEPSWGQHGAVTTPPYSRDSDLNSFSDSELVAIEQIWAQVSEDYAPFNINVTTVEPPSFANGVAMRVAIGGDGAWTGGNYGGIAHVNSFTSVYPNTVFVFPDHLNNGKPKSVAEASSHEAGHSFGLEHQSQFNSAGVKIAEYYQGPGNGTAPIMGNSYSATRGLWWSGTSTDGADRFQDDLSQLTRESTGIHYRTDDHGNNVASATPLPSVNGHLQATGLITTTSDRDYFSFYTAAGQLTISVTVPLYNNLDARLELRDASGTLIVSAAPTDSFGASIVTNVPSGSYRAVVASQGNYGDIGFYTITADVLSPSVEGTVFYDANFNGTRELVEGGLAGWRVFDDLNGNGTWDSIPQITRTAMDTPRATVPGTTIGSSITISGLAGAILDINVHVSLQHGAVSDLLLSLYAPDGSNMVLMAFNPNGGQEMSDTVFDSEATTLASNAFAPMTGHFRPLGDLSPYYGKNPNGTWSLTVTDWGSGHAGVLEDFSLEITTTEPEPSATTDAQGHYQLVFPVAGTHLLRQVDQTGYSPTLPGSSGYALEVSSQVANLDFGNVPPAVIARRLFYNNSKLDGRDPGINDLDDRVIAPDKYAYQAGQGGASWNSVSSYVLGLNGIMIDVHGLAGTITASDFQFRVGSDNSLENWLPGPAPSGILVRPGAGEYGSDRIVLTWATDAVRNAWLEVTLQGNDATGGYNSATGLPASDVFYFGSRVGDTGDHPIESAFLTNAADEIDVRSHVSSHIALSNVYDFNRDGLINASDEITSRMNTGSLVRLRLPGFATPQSISLDIVSVGLTAQGYRAWDDMPVSLWQTSFHGDISSSVLAFSDPRSREALHLLEPVSRPESLRLIDAAHDELALESEFFDALASLV